MHLARWPRTQRRLDSSVDAPHADTLHRRAVDFHSFSDLVVGQTRTIDPFVCLQQDARVHQGPRRSFAFRQQRLQLRPLVGHQFDSVHLHETALYRNSPTGRSCPDTSLGKDYELATVSYRYYESRAIPDDTVLAADLESVLTSYDRYLADKEEDSTRLPPLPPTTQDPVISQEPFDFDQAVNQLIRDI